MPVHRTSNDPDELLRAGDLAQQADSLARRRWLLVEDNQSRPEEAASSVTKPPPGWPPSSPRSSARGSAPCGTATSRPARSWSRSPCGSRACVSWIDRFADRTAGGITSIASRRSLAERG